MRWHGGSNGKRGRTPQGYLIRLSSREQVDWLGGMLAALR